MVLGLALQTVLGVQEQAHGRRRTGYLRRTSRIRAEPTLDLLNDSPALFVVTDIRSCNLHRHADSARNFRMPTYLCLTRGDRYTSSWKYANGCCAAGLHFSCWSFGASATPNTYYPTDPATFRRHHHSHFPHLCLLDFFSFPENSTPLLHVSTVFSFKPLESSQFARQCPGCWC